MHAGHYDRTFGGKKKGIRYAIAAVARVAASGRRVHYTIVGDGPLRRELERLIEHLGVYAHISLTGWKPHEEVLGQIDTVQVLVAPSATAPDGDEEGIPNAVNEAMAMGSCRQSARATAAYRSCFRTECRGSFCRNGM